PATQLLDHLVTPEPGTPIRPATVIDSHCFILLRNGRRTRGRLTRRSAPGRPGGRGSYDWMDYIDKSRFRTNQAVCRDPVPCHRNLPASRLPRRSAQWARHRSAPVVVREGGPSFADGAAQDRGGGVQHLGADHQRWGWVLAGNWSGGAPLLVIALAVLLTTASVAFSWRIERRRKRRKD